MLWVGVSYREESVKLRPKDALKFLASWEVTKIKHQARILHMKGPHVIKN